MTDRSKYAGINRRSDDVITGLLTDRIDMVAKMTQETQTELSTHVKSCEAMQKKVLVVVTALLAWEVATKPEVAKMVIGVFKAML